MYVRDGAIDTERISGSLTKTCRALLKGKLSPEQAVQTEGWPGYDGLVKECEWRYNRSLPQLLADIQHLITHNKEQMAHEDDLDGLGAKS